MRPSFKDLERKSFQRRAASNFKSPFFHYIPSVRTVIRTSAVLISFRSSLGMGKTSAVQDTTPDYIKTERPDLRLSISSRILCEAAACLGRSRHETNARV